MRETIPGKILGASEESRVKLLESVVNAEKGDQLSLAIKALVATGIDVPIKSDGEIVDGKAICMTDNDKRVALAFTKDGEMYKSWKIAFTESLRNWMEECIEQGEDVD